MERRRNYWGFRVNTPVRKFIFNELTQGRLRQGWGFNLGQDLRNLSVDEGARRNLRMFNQVKKDDILLIPRIPRWEEVTIVRATEDWDKGYHFDFNNDYKDFGHIFPVERISSFNRHCLPSTSGIRSTLHNRGRFWNMSQLGEDIEKIIASPESELTQSISNTDKFKIGIVNSFNNCFSDSKFSDEVYSQMLNNLNGTEWEYALVEGLKYIYPEPYFKVTRVGGKTEKYHGADITISFPSICDEYEYVIAIQVKDYEQVVSNDVINQISKADWYFNEQNKKIIDKIVIITKADKDINEELYLKASDEGVSLIFASDLKTLLNRMAKSYISKAMLNLDN